jgi:hypothetical protein
MEGSSNLTIHRSVILLVLAATPLMFLAGVANYYLAEASWLPYMGLASFLLPLYLLFFELPHILSSFIGFFDREYVRFYRRQLFFWLPMFLGGFAVLIWWNLMVAIVLYLVGTTYHVMRQQTGIALMFGVRKDRWHALWSWSAVLVTAIVYLTVGAPEVLGDVYMSYLHQITTLLLGVVAVVSLVIMSRTAGWQGRVYVLALPLMLIGSYYLFVIGYLFLSIFILRFVHDITAFIFYITHEVNRNREGVKNRLYKMVPFVPKALFVVVPAFGVGLGLVLREVFTSYEAIFIVSMLLAMTHYYLESIMWKRESLHRQYVKVV